MTFSGRKPSFLRAWIIGLPLATSWMLLVLWRSSIHSLPPSPDATEINSIEVYTALLNGRDEEIKREPIKSRTPDDLWEDPLHLKAWYKQCPEALGSTEKLSESSSGYLIVEPNGGLNQQRIGIATAVAVAWFLKATLIVPRLMWSPVWRDGSLFEDLFDLEHFKETLKDVVRIEKDVPRELEERILKTTNVTLIPPKLAPLEWYTENVLPLLKQHGVAILTEYMHPLTFGVAAAVEKMRCRANFQALRYRRELEEVAAGVVRELKGGGNGSDRFVAIHIRFQEDMLADSCCDFGGGTAEAEAFRAYRDVNLALGPLADKYKSKPPPEILRERGYCPLTPEEIGLLLAGMGYGKDARLYLAGGEIYGGEGRLAPLRRLFPKIETMETLVPKETLQRLRLHPSQLAAIDTYVCTHSDVFAATFSGSNFPSIVLGLRMMHGLGRSILPNKKSFVRLLVSAQGGDIGWENFAEKVKDLQVPKGNSRSRKESTFRNPAPVCMCQKTKF